MPYTRVLYAHLLGLTLGFLSILILTLPNLSSDHWLINLSYLIFFGIASYYFGGVLVVFSAITFFLPFSLETLPGELVIIFKWYFLFYMAGMLFAHSYNIILFFYIKKFSKHVLKISFAYNPGKKFNVIKSPIPEQAVPIENTNGIKPLYDFSVDMIPKHPYTILFVANPKLCTRKLLSQRFTDRDQFDQEIEKHRKNSENYEADPIISNDKLFFRMVDRALNSFENDEVLGRPEIWSSVRIITIFDPDAGDLGDIHSDPNWIGKQFGFAEAYQVNLAEADIAFENLLVPLAHATVFLEDKWQQYQAQAKEIIPFKDIDVIYVLSANENYDRSSAMYTDKPNGQIYSGFPPKLNIIHDEYADAPGIVALNVLTAWQKTYIHEFGHAMSALQNGAIMDEYMDYNEFNTDPDPVVQAVNRLERAASNQPIPSLFARYNHLDYHSDRSHPSQRETWKGYFPERWEKNEGCNMDATIGAYRFDPLISDFMYDRLLIKRNRP